MAEAPAAAATAPPPEAPEESPAVVESPRRGPAPALHPPGWEEGFERLKAKLAWWQPALREEIGRLDMNGAFLMTLHVTRNRARKLTIRSDASSQIWRAPVYRELIRTLALSPMPTRDLAVAFQVWSFMRLPDILPLVAEADRPPKRGRFFPMFGLFAAGLALVAGFAGGPVADIARLVVGLSIIFSAAGLLMLLLLAPFWNAASRFGYAFLALEVLPMLAGQAREKGCWALVRRPALGLVAIGCAAGLGTGWLIGVLWPGWALTLPATLASALAGWFAGLATMALAARSKAYDFDNIDPLAELWRAELGERFG